MKHTPISRRDFLKNLGIAGAGTLLAASPWLSAFSEVMNTSNEKCRLAIIGPGSRGRFLMGFLAKNPKVDIVALCDIYKPSIENALKLAPNAKVYGDYREVLEDKSIDAILVATPLSSHCKIVLDAFDAGKHVFCEKSIGFTMEDILHRTTAPVRSSLHQSNGDDSCRYLWRNKCHPYFLEPERGLETFGTFTQFGTPDKLASLQRVLKRTDDGTRLPSTSDRKLGFA